MFGATSLAMKKCLLYLRGEESKIDKTRAVHTGRIEFNGGMASRKLVILVAIVVYSVFGQAPMSINAGDRAPVRGQAVS